MRCNRKNACFAVTPREKAVSDFNITEIGQLRRREKVILEIVGYCLNTPHFSEKTTAVCSIQSRPKYSKHRR